jgi:hypothetical protein
MAPRSSRVPCGCREVRSGSTRLTLAAALLSAWFAHPAVAQSRLELDLAGTRIEYDTLAPLDAPSLSALTEWQRPSLFARASGSVTRFENSGWSAQGRADLAGWFAPFGSSSPARIELGGSLGGARLSSGFDSFLTRADTRFHLGRGGLGGWVGASVASARNEFDSAAVTGFVPNAGLWMQSGYLRGTLSYQHTRISGDEYPEANVALTLSRGAADLTVYGGARDSPISDGWRERWVGVSAVYWVTRNAAIVASGGGYSSDLLQGLPGGDFLSLGLRLTPRRVRPIPISAAAPIVYTSEEAQRGSIGFELEDVRSVEIAGDWNGWTPTPLTQDAAGRWVLPTALSPGVYRFNLRVDGERWVVPDGVPAADDGFGGEVGLLIVSAP